MNNFIIYGLIDPNTDYIRYIGKSVSGLKRAREHMKPSSLKNDGNTHKANWIRSLKKQNLKYNIIVLDKANNFNELYEKEQYWIQTFKSQNYEFLTNSQDGGPGSPGRIINLETRQKMSTSAKKAGLNEALKKQQQSIYPKNKIEKDIVIYNQSKNLGHKILATYKDGLQISFFALRFAEKYLGGTANKTAISLAIKNKKFYKDFYWEKI